LLLVICYWLFVIGYLLLVICYWLFVIGYLLLVICYWLFVIGYWLFVICYLLNSDYRLLITQELARLLVWEIGDRASYSLEYFGCDSFSRALEN
jgi:hypothetical protein